MRLRLLSLAGTVLNHSSDDQHAQYLTPMFALSGTIDIPLPSTPTSDNPEGTGLNSSLLPLYEKLSPEELEAYLAEMESDVRAADRDMLEIETLVRKGVTGAGKLGGQYLFAFGSLLSNDIRICICRQITSRLGPAL